MVPAANCSALCVMMRFFDTEVVAVGGLELSRALDADLGGGVGRALGAIVEEPIDLDESG
jgi:hypothetical protein